MNMSTIHCHACFAMLISHGIFCTHRSVLEISEETDCEPICRADLDTILEELFDVTVEADKCSICLVEMCLWSSIILKCGHIFHSECVGPWLKVKHICPKCRILL